MNSKYIELELKKVTSNLAKLVSKGSFLRGSPVIMKRVCGNPNCKCATKGKLHKSLYISKNKDGKRKMIYVPKDMEEEIKEKLKAYKKVKDLTEKISELNYASLEEDKKKKR